MLLMAGTTSVLATNDATPHAWRKGFVPLERATVEAGHPPLIFIPAAGGGPYPARCARAACATPPPLAP